MKKALLSILVLLIILALLISCNQGTNDKNEDSGSDSSDELTFLTQPDENEENCVSIIGYKGLLPNELVIPSEINGKTVVSIGNTFQNEKITSLELPETIEQIYGGAFNNCTSLKKLKLASRVAFGDFQDLGDYTFKNCPIEELTCFGGQFSVYKQEFLKNIKKLNIIEGNVNMNEFDTNTCPLLESVYFDKNAKGVSEGGFYSQTSLKSVVFHKDSKVTTLDLGAFCQCENLETVILPNNLKYIGNVAFAGCKIQSIELPNSLILISAGAFAECKSLKTVVFPNHIVELEENETFYPIFKDCPIETLTCYGGQFKDYKIDLTSLKALTINGGAVAEEEYVGSASLETLIFEEEVTGIAKKAFFGAELKYVTIKAVGQWYVEGVTLEIIPQEIIEDPQKMAEYLNENFDNSFVKQTK